MSLTYPPGLAFRAQLLCPELGQVYGTKGMFRGNPFRADLLPNPQTQWARVVSDSSRQEPLPMGPGKPTWISSPQREVSETQDSDFLLSAARLIIFSGCLSHSDSRASDVRLGSLSLLLDALGPC